MDENRNELEGSVIAERADLLLLNPESDAFIKPGKEMLVIGIGLAQTPTPEEYLPMCPSIFLLSARNPITVLDLSDEDNSGGAHGASAVLATVDRIYQEAGLNHLPINITYGDVRKFVSKTPFTYVFDHLTLDMLFVGDGENYMLKPGETRQQQNKRLVDAYAGLVKEHGKIFLFSTSSPDREKVLEISSAFQGLGMEVKCYTITDKYKLEDQLESIVSSPKYSFPSIEAQSGGLYVPVYGAETMMVIQKPATSK